jgi:hypothetical protein
MVGQRTFDEYVSILKDSAIKLGVQALERELSKRLPFLFWPVISPITSLILTKLVSLLIKQTEFGAFFVYIDMRVTSQGRAFQRAALQNYKVQQTGTEEEKKNAEEELIRRFRNLVILGQ